MFSRPSVPEEDTIMTAPLYAVVTLLVIVALSVVLRRPIREFFRMRGTRVITCPENKQPAAVHVDAGHAALTSAGGHERLRLESCSRGAAKSGWGQECVKQFAAPPGDCVGKTPLGN
jgi:hypothetical protein